MSRLIPRKLVVLMALMTVIAFCGPFCIGLVIRGGRSPDWPPDRPVEWYTLGGTTALLLILLVGTIAASIAVQRQERRAKLTRETTDFDPGFERPRQSGPGQR
jgi:hypothetical protein